MDIKEVLESINFSPINGEIKEIKLAIKEVIGKLNSAIKQLKIEADVFIGGSFAKGTLVKKEKQDIDVYLRFEQQYEDLSKYLEKIVKKAFNDKLGKLEKVHGSRDYFRLSWSNRIDFEMIPVLKIKNPKESRNVTDLSYFHVNYVKKKLKNKKLAREVVLAKAFCRAQKLYGAESYIQGFSGYALECLIINYKSFEKMLKELSKVKEREILDPEKKYKNKREILFTINENRLNNPVVLIDPTWKERNVLAALSKDTFARFQNKAREFLKGPSKKFFELERVDIEKIRLAARKNDAELVNIKINTNKQAGDIAGTKLKKFYRYVIRELSKYFEILEEGFEYEGGQSANSYIIAKSKKEVIRIGPPINMLGAAEEFKKKNKETFEKTGYLHSKIKIDFSAKEFLRNFFLKEERKVKEMGVSKVKVA